MNSPTLPQSIDTSTFCLGNARLVLQDRIVHGALHVSEGRIEAVQETDKLPIGAIDCGQDFILPGLVELHTDNLERHIQPRPKVDWPHVAAILAHDGELASCGITTVFDAMRVGSIPNGKGRYLKYARKLSREMLALRAENALKISHFLHLRAEVCSETLIEELGEFDEHDRVGIVSLMDHTPGQRQFRDTTKFKAYVTGKTGMNDTDYQEHFNSLLELRARLGDQHEIMTVKEAARFGAVLASHDDTTTQQVQTSADHGIRLAEFPTTVEAAQACRDSDIAIMMGAPNIMRGGSHSGNVSALELAELGLLDIVSSDYVPAALLQSAFRLATLWQDLPRAVQTVTKAPARASGLTDRGTLEPGMHADLLRITEMREMPVVRGVWSHGRRVG